MVIRSKRKAEHLALAVNSAEGPISNGFEDVYLLNNSIPDMAMEDIDLSIQFLGKTIQYPLLINSLTGGTEQAKEINRMLAATAGRFGLAMAVGSMTIAIEEPELKDSFTVVREMHPDGVVLANVAARVSCQEACEAVDMIQADGLQLHFNIPQELAMREGDRNFRGILENVARIVEACPVPVIAKEVGFGFSMEAVEKLYGMGIKIFDNGGSGGTNFLTIEDQRDGMFNHQLDYWGIPTAASLAEIISLQLPVNIVASGGIRTANDIAKAIALGAEMVGITGLFLKILLNEGQEELDRRIENLLYQLKSIFLMTGARDCRDLRTKPVIILSSLAEWLRAREIDPKKWSNRK